MAKIQNTSSQLVWILGLAVSLLGIGIGCEPSKTDADQKQELTARTHEQATLDRRRYDSWFETPFDNIQGFSGDCVAWGMSGQCAYRFESVVPIQLQNKTAFVVRPCDSFLPGLLVDFKQDNSHLIKKTDLTCYEGKTINNEDLLLVKNKVSNVYFVKNTFKMTGPTKQ